MLAAHNTFTYLKPDNVIFLLFTRFWKAQDKTLDELYNSGVKYFDIRVFRKKDKWGLCHGFVEFRLYFDSLEDILDILQDNYPDIKIRFVLDKGDAEKFEEEISSILEKIDKFPIIDTVQIFYNNRIGIRVSSKIFYHAGTNHIECCYNPGNEFKKIKKPLEYIKFLWNYDLKKKSKLQQPITQEMVDDIQNVYFYDYL